MPGLTPTSGGLTPGGLTPGCIIGGDDQGCPQGYQWPTTTPPPILNGWEDICAAGKAGVKFLAHWGFTQIDHVPHDPMAYVEQFFKAHRLTHVVCEKHKDPSSGTWFSFTFPGISPETCLQGGVDAWHGTTMFALPSIIKMKKLIAGPALPKGIYCHRQGSASKAQSYTCHTPIGHGLLLAPLLKLKVINPRKVRVDQWLVEDPSNCSIEKVFVRVVSISGLTPGREWLTKPWMESPPSELPF